MQNPYSTGEVVTLKEVLIRLDDELQPNKVRKLPKKFQNGPTIVKTAPHDDAERLELGAVYPETPEMCEARDRKHHKAFDSKSFAIELRRISELGIHKPMKIRGMEREFKVCRAMYKIHLMLSVEQLCSGNLQLLILYAHNDIMTWKYTKPLDAESLEDNRGKITNPTVVIYCRPEIDCARRTLQWALCFFGEMPMINLMIPRYNIHVAGPVYYSGGDSNVKDYIINSEPSLLPLFDEKTGYALYTGQKPLI